MEDMLPKNINTFWIYSFSLIEAPFHFALIVDMQQAELRLL